MDNLTLAHNGLLLITLSPSTIHLSRDCQVYVNSYMPMYGTFKLTNR